MLYFDKCNLNNSFTKLNIENLQVGAYIVKATIDGKIATSRLLKE